MRLIEGSEKAIQKYMDRPDIRLEYQNQCPVWLDIQGKSEYPEIYRIDLIRLVNVIFLFQPPSKNTTLNLKTAPLLPFQLE